MNTFDTGTNERGERLVLTVFRDGGGSLRVEQGGEWRTAELAPGQLAGLLKFLDEWEPEPEFTYQPVYSGYDPFVASWETAPMVPTVHRDAEQD